MREMLIEDWNLSVKVFNQLKRAGIHTVECTYYAIEEEGIDGIQEKRMIYEDSIVEILEKLFLIGYEVHPIIDRYLKENNFSDQSKLKKWKTMRYKLDREHGFSVR